MSRVTNPFRLLARKLKRRMSNYSPAAFPDTVSCGAFYDARNSLFSGDDMMILEYSGSEVQCQLFERAISLLVPIGKIIDLGCGFGHLASYLDEKSIPYKSYHGIDVSKQMVTKAGNRFKGRTSVSFEVRDILTNPFAKESFDTGYVLSVLGYPIGENPIRTMMEIIEKMFSSCRVGIVFSHVASDRKGGLSFTTVPEDLALRCERELGAKTELDDDGTDFTYLVSLRH